MWQANLARRLADRGLDDTRAAQVAALTIYATEGALVVARAERTLDALNTVADELSLLCDFSSRTVDPQGESADSAVL
jgi:TetR/AcrR family transcriptional regulator, lmrAB and yxaGH operons repressor